jgi:hypothetical protein
MGRNESYPAYHDAKLNWEDVGWLKDLAGGVPIYLKGVCHIEVGPLSVGTGCYSHTRIGWLMGRT